MRILTHLPQLAAVGGVETHMLQATRELAERGHRINLAYEQDGDLSAEFGSFCERLLKGPSVRYSHRPQVDLLRIARRVPVTSRLRADLLYSQNAAELPWANAVKLLTGAPIVCHLHEFGTVGGRALKLFASQGSRFVVATEYMARFWAGQGLPPERIEVVPYGFTFADYPVGSDVERTRHRKSLGLPADAYVVVCMGRIVPEKGVETLLDAWEKLDIPVDQARLLIVGTPENPRDENEYVRGLRARAPAGSEWLPMRRDVIGLLHASDVLVLPSLWDEPFGRVIVEAMSTGRPAVASAVGGIPEILDGEFQRMLFPRGDSDALAQRLREMADWRRDDPLLATRCVEHVEQKYSLADTVAKLETIFADALANRRRIGVRP